MIKESHKKIIKIAGVIMGGIGIVLAVVLFFGSLNFSCIAKPEILQNEPPACTDAKYIAYAFHRVEKVPETVISNGLATCRNQHIWNFCSKEVEEITDKAEHDRAFQNCWDKNKSQ